MIINFESTLRNFILTISRESKHTTITQSPVTAEAVTFVVSASKYRSLAEYFMDKGRSCDVCSLPTEIFVEGDFYLMHDYRIQSVKPCRNRDEIVITVFTNKPCTQAKKSIFNANELEKYNSKDYFFEFVSFHPFHCRVYPSKPEFGFEGKEQELRYGEPELKFVPKDDKHLCYGNSDNNSHDLFMREVVYTPFPVLHSGNDNQLEWSKSVGKKS